MKIQAGRYYSILDRTEMFGKAGLQNLATNLRKGPGMVVKIKRAEKFIGLLMTEEGYILTERTIQHLKPATRKQIAKYERSKDNVS